MRCCRSRRKSIGTSGSGGLKLPVERGAPCIDHCIITDNYSSCMRDDKASQKKQHIVINANFLSFHLMFSGGEDSDRKYITHQVPNVS
jgi:hypothetical protein